MVESSHLEFSFSATQSHQNQRKGMPNHLLVILFDVVFAVGTVTAYRSWNVAGRASIKLISQLDSTFDYSREIFHCFCARENDWGFSNFMVWKVRSRVVKIGSR